MRLLFEYDVTTLQRVARLESPLGVEGFRVVREVFSHGPLRAGKWFSVSCHVPFANTKVWTWCSMSCQSLSTRKAGLFGRRIFGRAKV